MQTQLYLEQSRFLPLPTEVGPHLVRCWDVT